MAVKKNLGTYELPLILNFPMPISTRDSFKRATIPYKGVDGVLFKDEPKAEFMEDLYYLNLVSNHILSKFDISIAIGLKYLIETNEDSACGEVFWTSDSEQPLEIGEEGEFWFEYDGFKNTQPLPFRSLRNELETLNIYVKNETLITSLRKLHGLHYITVTTKHGRGVDGDDPKVRSEIRHINIYEGMINRKIFRVWRKG
jgi:hypothetical protein